MGAEEDNGLTLGGLAQKLEALERENAELRRKVATLEGPGARSRDEVAALRAPGTPRDEIVALRGSGIRRDEQPADEPSVYEGQVSRRQLLGRVGAAAMGTVAAGALMLRDTREAKATHWGTRSGRIVWLRTGYRA